MRKFRKCGKSWEIKRKYARSWESMPEVIRKRESFQNVEKVCKMLKNCENYSECAQNVEKLCKMLRKCAKCWESVQNVEKVCKMLRKCAKGWESMRKCAKCWESKRKCANSLWKNCSFFWSIFFGGVCVKVSLSTAEPLSKTRKSLSSKSLHSCMLNVGGIDPRCQFHHLSWAASAPVAIGWSNWCTE